ncbi:MAG: hypothetical protein KF820_00555 [Candidatus Paracaedibacteraceae bacterium]|nr:hypothetical protein [Candidatus Paracaedibacteraceae bacterium]
MLHIGTLLFMGAVFSQDITSGMLEREKLIPLHHDAEGLAPLRIPNKKLSRAYRVYRHDIPQYLERLKQAFHCVQGEKTVRGIHMPDWIIWGFPSIKQTRTSLTLYIGNQTLENPTRIGKLNLKEEGLSAVEGVQRIRAFLDKYVDYDGLKISSYQAPLKKKTYSHNWTELDDLVLQMLMKGSKYQLVQGIDQDETVRLIGEFFRWRRIISEFCQEKFEQVNEVTLPQVFERFLITKHRMTSGEAKKYKYLLDLRRQHLGLILQDPNDNTDVMNEIFKNFTLYGLTTGQEQADRYRDQLFPLV